MKEYQRKVIALDQFKKAKLSERGIYICNEQTLQKSGSHWFLIITELDKVYFLDSFAQSPKHFGIERKINKLKKACCTVIRQYTKSIFKHHVENIVHFLLTIYLGILI